MWFLLLLSSYIISSHPTSPLSLSLVAGRRPATTAIPAAQSTLFSLPVSQAKHRQWPIWKLKMNSNRSLESPTSIDEPPSSSFLGRYFIVGLIIEIEGMSRDISCLDFSGSAMVLYNVYWLRSLVGLLRLTGGSWPAETRRADHTRRRRGRNHNQF